MNYKCTIPAELLQSPVAQGAIFILERLENAGYEAYWAGGAVRDFILKKKPHDIDIATSARPEQVVQIFRKTIPVGVQFGVIIVLVKGFSYEVATFRNDGQYLDGRRPENVTFSSAREDANRRDFTINGLFFHPRSQEIIDYVNGLVDLQGGLIRTIGSAHERFHEDKLRILRAPRFSLQLGFSIEAETKKAIQEMAKSVQIVSQERITEELKKIFSGSKPYQAASLLQELNLLEVLFPFMGQLRVADLQHGFWQLEQRKISTENQATLFDHVLGSLLSLEEMYQQRNYLDIFQDSKNNYPFLLVLGLLLQHYSEIHDKGNGTMDQAKNPFLDLEKKLGTYKLSNKEKQVVIELLKARNEFHLWTKARVAQRKRWIRDPLFSYKIIFYLSRFSFISYDKNLLSFILEEKMKYSDAELNPIPLLSGSDLIEMGYTPGPKFAEDLMALENEQLESTIHDRQEALAFIRKRRGI